MNVVGLGRGGCAVADLFSPYPEYKVYKIDVGIKGKNCFALPSSLTIEESEENVPEFIKLSKFKDKTLFVLCGGGISSGASLRILEKIKHTELSVLYIRPDPALTAVELLERDRVTFNILQEYARSGLIKKIILASNAQIENLLGGLTVSEYFDSINKVIVSTIHMINFLLTTDSSLGKMTPTRSVDRICSVGIYNIEDGIENLLHNITSPRQKILLYAIKESDLTQDKNLLRMIQQQAKKSYTGTEIDISYKITTTNYETNFVYIVSNTNILQE